MAEAEFVTITSLPAVVTPADTDLYAVWQGGLAKKISFADFKAAVATTFAVLASPTFTGTVGLSNLAILNALVGNLRALRGRTNNSDRWELALGDTTAEGGANAGSNLRLRAFSDAGASLGDVLTVARATRILDFLLRPTVAGANVALQNELPASWKLPFAACAYTGGTGAINASQGLTSLTRNSAGTYTVVLASAQPDANYVVLGGAANSSVSRETWNVYNKTTTGFQFFTDNGASTVDFTLGHFACFHP